MRVLEILTGAVQASYTAFISADSHTGTHRELVATRCAALPILNETLIGLWQL